MKKTFIYTFLLLTNLIFSAEIKENFKSLKDWEPLTFKGIDKHSTYEVKDGILITKSDASASGIVYKKTFNPYETPIITWKWMVENVYKKGDATKKSGDDFPLRIYILFKYDPSQRSLKHSIAKKLYGEYPPHSALNYIWDSKNPVGSIITNPYVKDSKEIVLQSGERNLKKWVIEKRNIIDDYKKAFGENPPKEASIAIMNDSDNTKEAATSYLDYIYIE